MFHVKHPPGRLCGRGVHSNGRSAVSNTAILPIPPLSFGRRLC